MLSIGYNQVAAISVTLLGADETPIVPFPSNLKVLWSVANPAVGGIDTWGNFVPTGIAGQTSVSGAVVDHDNKPLLNAASQPIVAVDTITVVGPVPDHAAVVLGAPRSK